MDCNNCGTELLDISDEGLKKAVIEIIKTCTPIGIIKGGYRLFNVIRGHLSDTIWQVYGFYYCPKCNNYKIQCPHCYHVIELGRNHPFQGDKYKCPVCGVSMIFYFEDNDDGYPIAYPPDYGY